jgi:hypothetical protein
MGAEAACMGLRHACLRTWPGRQDSIPGGMTTGVSVDGSAASHSLCFTRLHVPPAECRFQRGSEFRHRCGSGQWAASQASGPPSAMWARRTAARSITSALRCGGITGGSIRPQAIMPALNAVSLSAGAIANGSVSLYSQSTLLPSSGARLAAPSRRAHDGAGAVPDL